MNLLVNLIFKVLFYVFITGVYIFLIVNKALFFFINLKFVVGSRVYKYFFLFIVFKFCFYCFRVIWGFNVKFFIFENLIFILNICI